jgi:hypothetical protein
MEAQVLKTVGQIAGIGGLSLGVLLLVFRDIIRKNIFPKLSAPDSYRLLRLITGAVWSIAILGIVAWVYIQIQQDHAVQEGHAASSATVGTGIANTGEQIFESAVNIGIPSDELESLVRDRTASLRDLADAQKTTIQLLQEKLQLNDRQVLSALRAAGQEQVPPEQLGTKLVEIAARYKALQQLYDALQQDPWLRNDAKFSGLMAEAQTALSGGQIQSAEQLIGDCSSKTGLVSSVIKKISTSPGSSLTLESCVQENQGIPYVYITQLTSNNASKNFFIDLPGIGLRGITPVMVALTNFSVPKLKEDYLIIDRTFKVEVEFFVPDRM